MSPSIDACIACGGKRVEGVLRGHAFATQWVEGPAASWDAQRSEVRAVVAKRCTDCGRIDLHAGDVVHPGDRMRPSWRDPPPFE